MNKKGDAVKVDVQFYKMEGDEVISLNGTERRDTDKMIESYLGKYEDFVLTALSLQGNNSLFIDKSQSERKDLLAQFMGINVFDKLYDLASEDIKEVSVLLKNFKRTDFTTELATAENKLEELEELYEEEEIEKEGYEDRQEELNEQINELSAQLIPIDGNLNLTQLSDKRNGVLIAIKNTENLIETKEGNVKTYDEKIEELSEVIKQKSKLNGIDIEIAYSNYQEEQRKLVEAEKVHSNAKMYLSLAEEKIKHLDNHQYDPNCKFCCDNTFVKDAMKAKEALPELQQIVKDALIDAVSIQQTLDRWEGIEEQHKEYKELKDKHQKAKIIIDRAKAELATQHKDLELQQKNLESVEADIERYHANEASIQTNERLNGEIEDRRGELSKVTKDLREINQKLLSANADIAKTKGYIQSVVDKMEEAKGLEEQFKIYEYYLDAVKRDGVSYELIAKALPVIEGEVNNILQQIVEFGIVFDMSGKNVNARIIYEDQHWPLEMCSGMEKFISGLAIRVALINVCNLPRPNFLVIDEGFGTLDSDNLQSIFMMFDYLKTQFDFINIISHLDAMRDIVDTLVEIKKIDGFSQIQYK